MAPESGKGAKHPGSIGNNGHLHKAVPTPRVSGVVDELAKWLLTLKASDITPLGAVLVACVVSAWLLGSDRIVLGSRYREVVAERDRLRESGEKCASAQERSRDDTMQLRLDLQQARFERDWYQRHPQEQAT